MRSRNENSRYRQKRGEAQAGNLEKKYGSDFGVRSDMKLETLRRQTDGESLTPMLKEQHVKNLIE
ncbi:hypothetical protein NSS79_12970 [Paenibacillus sp. FSL L8-0436]|uniref:hypothetical protein n=1 Tax=Paenibacillus sp. FSL L8-0436 TaxID=2954686 RepID=UPI003158C5AA